MWFYAYHYSTGSIGCTISQFRRLGGLANKNKNAGSEIDYIYTTAIEVTVTHANCNEATNVCHVGHQVGTDIVTNLPHSGVVQDPGIGTGPCYDDTGVEIPRLGRQSVVVYQTCTGLETGERSHSHTAIHSNSHTPILSNSHTAIFPYHHAV